MALSEKIFTRIKKVDADELNQLKKRTDIATLVNFFYPGKYFF